MAVLPMEVMYRAGYGTEEQARNGSSLRTILLDAWTECPLHMER